MTEAPSRRGRRLPVYLLLDCSGSMAGEPIEALKMGLRMLVSDLKSDPHAVEVVWLSVITFSDGAQQVVPLTYVNSFQDPVLEAAGQTSLGEALRLLISCMDKEVIRGSATQRGDWRPLVYLMTDGKPTDSDWEQAAQELSRHDPAPAVFLACAAGSQADETTLRKMTETVVRLRDTSQGTLGQFMKLLSMLTQRQSQKCLDGSGQGQKLELPPAGPGVEMVP